MDIVKKSQPVANSKFRVLLYARVSTEDQKDNGYSLPDQIAECREYAARKNFEVVAVFQEDITGMVPFMERPEGGKAIALLKHHEADIILVHRADRFARDMLDGLIAIRLLLRMGIEVYILDIGKVESESNIELVIKAWQAGEERKKIIDRTSRGRYRKAKLGKVVGNGWALYGYRYADGAFSIHEPEAKTVRLIYHWYVEGDEEHHLPLSMRAIAKRLSELGIPCPGEKIGLPRKRESGMWNPVTISLILTHEAYAGVWRYARTKHEHGRRSKRSIDEQIAVNVPPIIDRATWEAAQARRAYNRSMNKRNTKHPYLLQGYIRCGCGLAMAGERGGRSKRYYYRCPRLHKHFTNLEQTCHELGVRQDVIEPIIWHYIEASIIQNPNFEQALRDAQSKELEGLQPKREQLEIVDEQIRKTEKDAAEIAEALKKVPRGGVVEKNLLGDMERTEKLYAAQIKKRDE